MGKRKGGYHNKGSKKARYGSKLEGGMRGVLITCNKREREAVREAYNLLNEYADKLYGPEKGSEDDPEGMSSEEEEDIDAALKKEVNSLKNTKPSQRRFQQVDTGTNNVVFVRTSLDNPTELVHAIFTDCLQSQQSKSRFILRMLPVMGTCSAYDDRITALATEVLEPVFSHGQPTTYSLQIKVRNNNGMSRTSLLPVLGRVMETLNPNARVDFSAPETIVNLDVLKTVACISSLKDFNKFRKYNIQEIIETNRTVNKVKTKGGDKNETDDKQKDVGEGEVTEKQDGTEEDSEFQEKEKTEDASEIAKETDTKDCDGKQVETLETTETQETCNKPNDCKPESEGLSEKDKLNDKGAATNDEIDHAQ